MTAPMEGGNGPRGVAEVVTLEDFTPGIVDNVLPIGGTSPHPPGAAQIDGTWGCFGSPDGGLIPLPRVKDTYRGWLPGDLVDSLDPNDRRQHILATGVHGPSVQRDGFTGELSSYFEHEDDSFVYVSTVVSRADNVHRTYVNTWERYRPGNGANGVENPNRNVKQFDDTFDRSDINTYGFAQIANGGTVSTTDAFPTFTFPGADYPILGVSITAPATIDYTIPEEGVKSAGSHTFFWPEANTPWPPYRPTHTGLTFGRGANEGYEDGRTAETLFRTQGLVFHNTRFIAPSQLHMSSSTWRDRILGGFFQFSEEFDCFDWGDVNILSDWLTHCRHFEHEYDSPITACVSWNGNQLFVARRAGGGFILQGAMAVEEGSIVNLPAIPPAPIPHAPARTVNGVMYGGATGVYLWTGGGDVQPISSRLRADFWVPYEDGYGIELHEGLRGQWLDSYPFTFVSNSFVFDIRTGGWWRLREVTMPKHRYAYYARGFNGDIFASPVFFDNEQDEIDDETTNNVVADIYDPNAGTAEYQWRSQPLSPFSGQMPVWRDVVVTAQGKGTVTVTLENPVTGTASEAVTFVFTEDWAMTQRGESRQRFSFRAHNPVVTIHSEASAPTDAAPIVWKVDLGVGLREET